MLFDNFFSVEDKFYSSAKSLSFCILLAFSNFVNQNEIHLKSFIKISKKFILLKSDDLTWNVVFSMSCLGDLVKMRRIYALRF